MYINFTPHKANVNNSSASSCANIFEYLEKEERGFVEEYSFFKEENNESIGFFNQENINLSKEYVIQNIDENRGKRGVKESNFYMINISPSYLEQKHLIKRVDQFLEEKIINEKLKLSEKDLITARDVMMRDLLMNYSREVMKEYANNFNREINGKKLSENDLMYYGRVETRRTYNFRDKNVIENKKILDKINKTSDRNEIKKLQESLQKDYFTGDVIKEGSPKGGFNYHVHIVVSRHDNTNDSRNKISLSPMTQYRSQNSKLNNQVNKTIGFNRDVFFENAEKSFDQYFNYRRDYSKSYEAHKKKARTKGIRELTKQGIANSVKKELSNYAGITISNPSNLIKMQLSQTLGINIPTHLKIPTNPVQLTLKVAKTVAKTIEKGYGM